MAKKHIQIKDLNQNNMTPLTEDDLRKITGGRLLTFGLASDPLPTMSTKLGSPIKAGFDLKKNEKV